MAHRSLTDIDLLIELAKTIPDLDVFNAYPKAVSAALDWLNAYPKTNECEARVISKVLLALDCKTFKALGYVMGHKKYARSVAIKICDDDSLGSVMSALIIYCLTEVSDLDTFKTI